MGFEFFDKSNSVYGRSPNVTIQPRGLMSINQSAYRRMGSPDFVLLGYDREANKIAIVGTGDEDKGYKANVAKRPGSPATVSGAAFLNYYNIGVAETRRWTPSFDDGMLIVDLDQPGRTVGSRQSAEDEEAEDDVPAA